MRFSLRYGGKTYGNDDLTKSECRTRRDGDVEIISEVYTLDCLKIERELRVFGDGARHSLFYLCNCGAQNSPIVSDIFDIDECLEIGANDAPLPAGYTGKGQDITKITWVTGSTCTTDEYRPYEDKTNAQGNRYSCSGGRSSQQVAPFFEVNNGKDQGFILAIGWSGQWFAQFDREGSGMRVRAGVEDVSFYLKPGERVRTASVLVVNLSGHRFALHNRFRKIMREHFSYRNRTEASPLSLQTWGGSSEAFLIQAAETAGRENLGFEYFWVDAGWYGDYEGRSLNEHTGEWGNYTGDWQANPRVHPSGLADVFHAAQKNGMKPLLWLEPERVVESTELYRTHPDWVLKDRISQHPWTKRNFLLNLGMEEVKEWVFDLCRGLIERLGIKCLRIDFNIEPLEYWRQNDEFERSGMNQIKHIMALYEIWDRLTAEYPDLIIDNCASGGRRIDIETCARSIPLWQSDMQCAFDYDPLFSQNQNVCLSWWLPEHGCGIGKDFTDRYRARSCYASALTSNFMGYEEFQDSVPDYSAVRETVAEYKSVRAYFDCDYYPIFGFPLDDTTWTGGQYDRPELGDGIVMAFRRAESPFETVCIPLYGLRECERYEFVDADEGTRIVCSGEELIRRGLNITIDARRKSKLFRYRTLF